MKKFFKDQEERYLSKFQKSAKIELKAFEELDEVWGTVEVIEPMLYNSIMSGADGVITYFANEKYKANTEWVSQWVARIALKESRLITETTKNALLDEIREGVGLGESVQLLADRVKTVFDFASTTRATLIARTETARGIAEGQRRNLSDIGYYNMNWVLSDDACEECIAQSEKEWNVDTIEGAQPVHPNCQCSMAPKGSLLNQLD